MSFSCVELKGDLRNNHVSRVDFRSKLAEERENRPFCVMAGPVRNISTYMQDNITKRGTITFPCHSNKCPCDSDACVLLQREATEVMVRHGTEMAPLPKGLCIRVERLASVGKCGNRTEIERRGGEGGGRGTYSHGPRRME